MRATKTLIRRNELLLFFVRSFCLDIKNIHYSTDNLRDYKSVYDVLKCCNNYASCSNSTRQSCALYTEPRHEKTCFCRCESKGADHLRR